jgi:RsiW-degrading membrane proteinase PrsW (M82 family)
MLKIFILALLTAIVWIVIVKAYQGKQPLSFGFLVVVAMMGGAFACEMAAIFNTIFSENTGLGVGGHHAGQPFSSLFHAYYIGFNEEFWKLLAAITFLHWHRERIRRPLEVIIICSTVAMGFEMIENISYGYHYDWLLVITRAFMPGHLLFGAIWGYGLKEYYTHRHRQEGRQMLILCWILGAALHATFNFLLFMNSNWMALVAISLLWIPMPYMHRVLREVGRDNRQVRIGDKTTTRKGFAAGDRNGSTQPAGGGEGRFSESGRHPSALGRPIYLSPQTLEILEALQQRHQARSGHTADRHVFIQAAITHVHHMSSRNAFRIEDRYFTRTYEKPAYSELRTANAVSLSQKALQMLDEIRHYTRKRSGRLYSRDQYLNGLIHRFHDAAVG